MRIEIIKEKTDLQTLKQLAEESFGDMVKVVVDTDRKIMAAGGEIMRTQSRRC